jgi:histidine triad (HIT) family protein
MEETIFTKIINGDIPSHKVYEDDKTFAFMDISPLRPGHVLVVPKAAVDHFDDLPDEDYQALFDTVRKVSKRVKTVLQSKRAVILIEGFEVPHAHVHVVPADSTAQVTEALNQKAAGESTKPADEELARLAQALAF